VRRGNTAYLTRTDGTLLSVPVSEIDREATAVARTAPPPPDVQSAPASTPAEVARSSREGPKARIRITDADVSHPLEYQALAGEESAKPETLGGPRVEVSDYTYEKSGPNLLVRGTLRNPGQGSAEGIRLNVSAFDGKGLPIGGTVASLSKGVIESGLSIAFTASMPIGEQSVGSLRFAPQWTGGAPASAAAPAAPAGNRPAPAADRPAPGTAASAQTAPPQPAPTPYGRGTLYAAPAPNAPSQAPADGKTGYIPGATSPDNQPKPPNP
ncbi:MAG: hypothetical protein M3R62_14025, partial [Acidobacteriota bacterium]|nr:hypothetical protein [Acidobacteriota bacterium]